MPEIPGNHNQDSSEGRLGEIELRQEKLLADLDQLNRQIEDALAGAQG